jgi:hypothetical protein
MTSHAKLVSGNSRIAEKGHLAQKTAEIGSANADAMHAHQGFARAGCGRLRTSIMRKLCGFSN